MNKVLLVVALMLGGLIGYVDSRPNWDDTGVTAAALLVCCGLLAPPGQAVPGSGARCGVLDSAAGHHDVRQLWVASGCSICVRRGLRWNGPSPRPHAATETQPCVRKDRVIAVVILPGMDGTGIELADFAAALEPELHALVVRYPNDRPMGYAEHEQIARASLPSHQPFVLLGESYSGPIAVSIAESAPPGLIGLVLCCTFVRNPRPALSWLRPLVRSLTHTDPRGDRELVPPRPIFDATAA